MNILITGGTGFIGSHLVHKLVNLNHKIFVIKRSSSDIWRLKSIKNKIKFLNVDALENLTLIFKTYKFDTIFHLAMIHHKNPTTVSQIKEMNYVNIDLPSAILQLAANEKVPYFINTGTCFEYKITQKKISEKSTLSPYDYYASTKIAFEDILKYFTRSNKIKGITLKLFHPYGEKNNTKVISLMIQSIIKGDTMELTKGEQQLPYTYVSDLVDSYIKAMALIKTNGIKQYEVFNIGPSSTYSLKQIGKVLEKLSNQRNLLIFKKPYPAGEIMYIACNNSKAKRLLKWSPKTDIIEGLENMYKYYLNQE